MQTGHSRPRARKAGRPVSLIPRVIMALVLREMATTYGRSPGGYLWAILEPAAGIALLTAIFSMGFNSPPLGTSFPLFYASGMLPFLMYNDLAIKLGQTIPFSRQLLEYPRVSFIDALLARLLLNALTQLAVSFLIIAFIILVMRPDTALDLSEMAFAYILVLCLSAGVGFLNAFLFFAYPLWQTAWAILNRPMFIISCVFFLFESVPQPFADLLWFNPLVHISGLMRDGFYPFYHPSYVSVAYVLVFSAVLAIAGLLLLYRYQRDTLLT
jgi:capsular polysaccharide transport system permease protein